jgi:hypothetical protein
LRIYQPNPAERVCVIGITGEGKSEWRRQYLANIYRCILWNPMEDLNIGEVITLSQLQNRVDQYRSAALHVTVHPTEWEPTSMSAEFDEFCGVVEEIGAVHLAIEEIGLVASPTRVPGNFNRLCVKGRHREISISIYGQRFHQFPLIARGQASEIVAFSQSDPDDVRDFKKRIAPAISPVPLNELPQHHFIRYTRETGPVLCAPLTIPNDPRLTKPAFEKQVVGV